ncbi:MAG: mechanosensitive ion channel family protein [Bacteroidota bacterium]
MDNIIEILERTYLGNTVETYLWFVGILILGASFTHLLSKLISRLLYRFFRKQAAEIGVQKFFHLIKKPMRLFIILIFVYLACDRIEFPQNWHLLPRSEFGLRMVLISIYEITLISSIIWLCLRVVDFSGMIFMKKAEKEDNKLNDQLIPFAVDILKILVVILGIFVILGSVFMINIGSLIAGLGIGGLAVALAAKETLENLFGSFAIFLDKPFMVGDLVKVGNFTGTVEKIGFRSTRLRTLDKTYMSIPNKKMIDSELDNITQRSMQRVMEPLYFAPSTPRDTIKTMIAELEKAISAHPKVGDTNIKFDKIENNTIKMMVLYFIQSTEWDVYVEVKQAVNFDILEIVRRNKAELAAPMLAIGK